MKPKRENGGSAEWQCMWTLVTTRIHSPSLCRHCSSPYHLLLPITWLICCRVAQHKLLQDMAVPQPCTPFPEWTSYLLKLCTLIKDMAVKISLLIKQGFPKTGPQHSPGWSTMGGVEEALPPQLYTLAELQLAMAPAQGWRSPAPSGGGRGQSRAARRWTKRRSRLRGGSSQGNWRVHSRSRFKPPQPMICGY